MSEKSAEQFASHEIRLFSLSTPVLAVCIDIAAVRSAPVKGWKYVALKINPC